MSNSRLSIATQTPSYNNPENLQETLELTTEELFSIPKFLIEKISAFGWSLVTAVLVLIIGFWITSWIMKLIEKRMIKRNVDLSIRSFALPIINIVLKILVIIPVIGQLGLNVSGFLATLTGVGLAVGLALQGSLSNFAAGLLIILFKPFKIGDYIVSQGNEGTVESISMLNTVISTPKGLVITLPNANLFNNPITNYSIKEFRRLDVNVGISYNDDFDKAQKVLLEVLDQNELVDDNHSKTVEILAFGDSSVDLAVRCYVKNSDYWTAYWQLYKAVKVALDKNEISIPYPHTQMIIKNEDSAPSSSLNPQS
ncbi:mechanosensitive ion channel family protein [Vaginella massiliensis]|uniref:mechanosensitive ion channel family protein n=1 Tax=Vaginella massiliensis TaxID=1816680 RepID=UPI000B9A2BBA|nr:mechanosensitive ion channel family protein [Vaginella massiliensis]